MKVVIVGAGAFGVSSALALRARGHEVTLADAAAALPRPHERASSVDRNRFIRADYGSDLLHVRLAREAIRLWQARSEGEGLPVYHHTGIAMLTRESLDEKDSFMGACFRLLSAEGFPVTRLNAAQIAERYPQYARAGYVDGYANELAGWCECGNALEQLLAEAREAGVALASGFECTGFVREPRTGRVVGARAADGRELRGDLVIAATGCWTPALVPGLEGIMEATGQPVIFYRPDNPDEFRGPAFPPTLCDIARTGWYVFCADSEGLVKIGNHGPGIKGDPRTVVDVPNAEAVVTRFDDFLKETIPGLLPAKRVGMRLCYYADTFDGDFLIDHHPSEPGLLVAAGGSGHGFKFAPVIGDIVADVAERKTDSSRAEYIRRYRWRRPQAGKAYGEQARSNAVPLSKL